MLVLEQGDIETALRKGFIDFDKEMASDEEMREDLAGTTAICVVIKDDKLYCGNVGDSRAIASINGNVEILSTDHKPNNDDERKRITAAGGWVEFNRVNGKNFIFEVLFLNVFFIFKGNLALSRALGDFIFKRNTDKRPEEQVVTGEMKKNVSQWNLISFSCS